MSESPQSGLFVVDPLNRKRLNVAKAFFKSRGSEIRAVTAGQALNLVFSGARPHLILIDKAMPQLCRDSFVDRLRQTARLKDVPIVIGVRCPDPVTT